MRCNCWQHVAYCFSASVPVLLVLLVLLLLLRLVGCGEGEGVVAGQEADGDACHPAVKSASSVPSDCLSLHISLCLSLVSDCTAIVLPCHRPSAQHDTLL